MNSRGTVYRSNLISFSDPRREGIDSGWKQNLETVRGREILSGEIVELMTIVAASTRTLNANSRVRFDIFDEDFLLTSDSHDRIISFVGTGT